MMNIQTDDQASITPMVSHLGPGFTSVFNGGSEDRWALMKQPVNVDANMGLC